MITVRLDRPTLPTPCRILDVGCGTGRHLAAALTIDQAEIVGLDPKVEDLHQARQRLELHRRLGVCGRNVRCYLAGGGLGRLPFHNNAFDLIICSEVLEHLEDIPGAIRELARVLTPDGQLIISVPRRWPEAICWWLSEEYRNTLGGHQRIFKAGHLCRMVCDQGFSHTHTHWAHSLHVPFWWLKCLVGVNRDDFPLVRQYHRFLVWDIMSRPKMTRTLERWLNPILGKSVVMYFQLS